MKARRRRRKKDSITPLKILIPEPDKLNLNPLMKLLLPKPTFKLVRKVARREKISVTGAIRLLVKLGYERYREEETLTE